jgi:hypothetical protein
MILNMIVCSTRKELCNLRPSVTKLLVCLYYQIVFLFSPLVFLNIWIKVIMPSLSALLSYPSRKGGSDLRPVLGTVLDDHLD